MKKTLLGFAFLLLMMPLLAKGKGLVSIGGSVSELVVALGHEKDLAAVDLSSVYPTSLARLPKVGYWLRLSQEGILSLKPKMVLASEFSKPAEVLSALKNFGIETHLIDDKPNYNSVIKKIEQVGKILKEEKKAQQLVSKIEANVKKAQREIKNSDKKVLFLFYRTDSKLMAAGKNTAADYLMGFVGASNAVDFSNYRIISQEAMIALNPDVIIIGDIEGSRFDVSKVDNKAILLSQAGKTKQVYRVDMLVTSGFGARFDEAVFSFSCFVNQNKLSFCK